MAWAESISIRGYNRTTVRHIVELSGISRSVFYRHFAGKEEAFLAVHADALTWLDSQLDVAARAEHDWSSRVAAALVAVLRAAVDHPREAQLLVGDPFGAGPANGYCHDLLVARFAPRLAAGRSSAQIALLPSTLETGLLGSLIGIVSARVRSELTHTLPALGQSLTEFVLTPYLGASEARRVALAFSSTPPHRTE